MIRRGISILVVTMGIVAPAWAHHSHVAYEAVKIVEVDGVVAEVKWANPHMTVILDVPTQEGKTEPWLFEGSSTSSTLGSGMTADVLKIGNRVKIFAHPSRNPAKREALLMGLEWNGKVYARGAGTNIRGKADD